MDNFTTIKLSVQMDNIIPINFTIVEVFQIIYFKVKELNRAAIINLRVNFIKDQDQKVN